MTAALLLAEPEPAIRGYLERQLQSDGFHVLQAAFGGEALALAERTRPDLVLCSELELCARLRQGEPGRTWNRDVPVIVLGPAEGDAVDRVRAFQRGADDYLHRPVVYDELVARIRAVLRRVAPPAQQRLEVGGLVVDLPARVVTVRGEPIHLAGKEFELLAALAAEPTRVFTKDELLRDVWGYRSFTRTRTLDSHVSRLRAKLERNADDRFVVNVWGVGYKLDPHATLDSHVAAYARSSNAARATATWSMSGASATSSSSGLQARRRPPHCGVERRRIATVRRSESR